MGCDVSILSKHNLSITNVETLAFDLANRLNLNIDYGYYATKEYNDLLSNGLEDNLIKLGSITKNDTTAKYLLVDENYQKKQLYLKFGDELFEMKEYWCYYDGNLPDEETITQERKDITVAEFFLESIVSAVPDEYEYMSVYDEILSNDLFYYTRWWDLCRTMQNSDEKDYLHNEYFQDFRNNVMKSTLALGGDKAYFVNDQCEHLKGVGQGNEMYYTWNNLEQFINSTETLEIISISKAVSNKEYQIEVSKKEMRDLAFVDDFTDLNKQ